VGPSTRCAARTQYARRVLIAARHVLHGEVVATHAVGASSCSGRIRAREAQGGGCELHHTNTGAHGRGTPHAQAPVLLRAPHVQDTSAARVCGRDKKWSEGGRSHEKIRIQEECDGGGGAKGTYCASHGTNITPIHTIVQARDTQKNKRGCRVTYAH
jgi:hypothetical protein